MKCLTVFQFTYAWDDTFDGAAPPLAIVAWSRVDPQRIVFDGLKGDLSFDRLGVKQLDHGVRWLTDQEMQCIKVVVHDSDASVPPPRAC